MPKPPVIHPPNWSPTGHTPMGQLTTGAIIANAGKDTRPRNLANETMFTQLVSQPVTYVDGNGGFKYQTLFALSSDIDGLMSVTDDLKLSILETKFHGEILQLRDDNFPLEVFIVAILLAEGATVAATQSSTPFPSILNSAITGKYSSQTLGKIIPPFNSQLGGTGKNCRLARFELDINVLANRYLARALKEEAENETSFPTVLIGVVFHFADSQTASSWMGVNYIEDIQYGYKPRTSLLRL